MKKVTREIAQNSLESIRKKGYITGGSDLNDTFDWNIVVTYINNLQSLTPPTKEQVCKALSVYTGEVVRYDNEEDSFISCYNDKICCLIRYIDTSKLLVKFYIPLPPHLITMIGRFYEGIDSK